MKILAIDSSTITASCAVAENDIVLGEYSLSHKKTHSEKLMPLIERLLADVEIAVEQLDYIVVAKGPGSYTGLRIGAAIGKSMAYALKIPMVAVPTMESLAANVYTLGDYIVPILDAKAGRVYTGIYKWENQNIITVKEQFPANIDELSDELKLLEHKIIFNGDGAEVYREILEAKLGEKAIFAPNNLNQMRASSTAWVGYQMIRQGNCVTADEFMPEYLRLSQAERNKKLQI